MSSREGGSGVRRSVLVTGGTGAVGARLVEQFAHAGYDVSFLYRRNDALARGLAESFGARSARCDFLDGDFALKLDPELLGPDVLINAAGVLLSKDVVHNVSDDEYSTTVAINVTAPFKLMRAVLPRMAAQRWGRVINIGSIYSLRSTSSNASYNLSKYALHGLTVSAALDYAADNITCNLICPSAIESELMTALAARKEAEGVVKASEYLDSIRRANPANRMAYPRDIATLALFLASEDASFINGTAVPVDGGQIA